MSTENWNVLSKVGSRGFRGRVDHTVDGSLTAQLFQHLGGTGEPISRLSDGDVKHELLDAKLPHGVRALVVSFRLCSSLDMCVF